MEDKDEFLEELKALRVDLPKPTEEKEGDGKPTTLPKKSPLLFLFFAITCIALIISIIALVFL